METTFNKECMGRCGTRLPQGEFFCKKCKKKKNAVKTSRIAGGMHGKTRKKALGIKDSFEY